MQMVRKSHEEVLRDGTLARDIADGFVARFPLSARPGTNVWRVMPSLLDASFRLYFGPDVL
jgi:hypothetical protein